MKNGMIIVDGSAGLEVGMRMRRGTIVLGGPARDFCGLQMKGGTIILRDGAEIRTGAWMQRGTIISLKPLQLMPTFAYCSDFNPTFLNVYAQQLKQQGIELPFARADGMYQRYAGDLSVPGKGEILVWNGTTAA
jgi:formylmethanofuran dehydrogenase subunit C